MKLKTAVYLVGALIATGKIQGALLQDASYTPTTNGGGLAVRNTIMDAQTFTVQNTGNLVSVAVELFTYTTPTSLLSISIRTVSGQSPSESDSGPNILFAGTILPTSVSTTAAFVSVPVSGVSVIAGQLLAITLSATGSNNEYYWAADLDWPQFSLAAGTYAGGRAFDRGQSATVQNGSGYTSGSSTWTPVFLYNSPGNTNGPNSDFGFKTFVDATTATPEPGTWLLFGFGFAALAARRLRTK